MNRSYRKSNGKSTINLNEKFINKNMQIHEAEALLTYLKGRLEDYVDDLCRDEGDIERIGKVVEGAYFILNDLESTLDMQCACDLSKSIKNR